MPSLAGNSTLDLTASSSFEETIKLACWPAGGNVGGTNDFGSSGNTGQMGSNTGGGVGGTNDLGSSGNTGSLGSGGGGKNQPRCTLIPLCACHVNCSERAATPAVHYTLEKKKKEKTTPFGVNLMRSPV